MTDKGELKVTMEDSSGNLSPIAVGLLHPSVIQEQLYQLSVEATTAMTEYVCTLLYHNQYGSQVKVFETTQGKGSRIRIMSLENAVGMFECLIDQNKRDRSEG